MIKTRLILVVLTLVTFTSCNTSDENALLKNTETTNTGTNLNTNNNETMIKTEVAK